MGPSFIAAKESYQCTVTTPSTSCKGVVSILERMFHLCSHDVESLLYAVQDRFFVSLYCDVVEMNQDLSLATLYMSLCFVHI